MEVERFYSEKTFGFWRPPGLHASSRTSHPATLTCGNTAGLWANVAPEVESCLNQSKSRTNKSCALLHELQPGHPSCHWSIRQVPKVTFPRRSLTATTLMKIFATGDVKTWTGRPQQRRHQETIQSILQRQNSCNQSLASRIKKFKSCSWNNYFKLLHTTLVFWRVCMSLIARR